TVAYTGDGLATVVQAVVAQRDITIVDVDTIRAVSRLVATVIHGETVVIEDAVAGRNTAVAAQVNVLGEFQGQRVAIGFHADVVGAGDVGGTAFNLECAAQIGVRAAAAVAGVVDAVANQALLHVVQLAAIDRIRAAIADVTVGHV